MQSGGSLTSDLTRSESLDPNILTPNLNKSSEQCQHSKPPTMKWVIITGLTTSVLGTYLVDAESKAIPVLSSQTSDLSPLD